MTTVNYKMADKFTFLVGPGLTIQNVLFNAIDSVIHPDYDVNNCLTTAGTCCTASGSTLSGTASCKFIR